jgi:succinyl-CoA synthetase alpha subunit
MAVLIEDSTKVIIQGITGSVGRTFADRISAYGNLLVGGVTPGKNGQKVSGVEVFDSVKDAVDETGANFSMTVVPKQFVKNAVLEAVDAGIKTVCVYAEGVPIHEALIFLEYARLKGTRMIGPNAAGIVSSVRGNISDINDNIVRKGRIGVISKSGTLTYELLYLLYKLNLGVSTVTCLGGDMLIGTRPIDVLKLFESDPETDLVIMLGELGGRDEIAAADYLRQMKKPVYAYISGLSVPLGVRMGHAGALTSAEKETARYKLEYLRKNGAKVARNIIELSKLVSGDTMLR